MPGLHRRAQTLFLATFALAGAIWYFWTAAQPHFGFWDTGPTGYYGFQTEGFLRGQLNVTISPAPELLALKDPYDPVANAPYRIHDMTLWNGRYYLYYGATPIVTFFLPLKILTGWYPTEGCAVALFCSAGLLVGLAVLGAVRRRHFPKSPLWALALGGAVLAWGSPVIFLTVMVQFYQVPIAAAFVFHLLMLGAIFRALCSRPGSVWWLAMASAAFGLSLGARPNYLPSGAVLLIPFCVLAWRVHGPSRWFAWVRFGVAAFGPALIAGLGLLFYNWVRFGDPAEFGMIYALSGEKGSTLKLMSLDHVWPRLHDYLLGEGFWMRYFPFFSSTPGAPYGALRYGPWLLLIFAALIIRGEGRVRGRVAFIWSVAGASLANLTLLLFFLGRAERYVPDYLPAALLAAGIGGLAVGERFRRRCVAGLGMAGGAGLTVFFVVMLWFGRLPVPERILSLARWANTPTAWWEELRGKAPGGLRVELELPRGREGLFEPIVHMGLEPDRRDWLHLEYLEGERARFVFFHAGLGRLDGREFAIPPNRQIILEFECGALLPPRAHPRFSKWTEAEYTGASRTLRVRQNGNVVLEALVSCYGSTAGDVLVGQMRWPSGGVQRAFTGKLGQVTQYSPERPKALEANLNRRVPLELKLRFPGDQARGREPLVSSGAAGRFDMLFCEYVGLGRARFGLYHHGEEPLTSEVFPFDPTQVYTLRIWMGSLADPEEETPDDASLPRSKLLTVTLDDRVLLNREQDFYAASPESLMLAENRFPVNVVAKAFSGRIEQAEHVGFDALPDPGLLHRYGAVDATVLFSRAAQGAAEPLVVTGVEGAGNFIYLRYLEGSRLLFGFDHWGVGGLVGKPVQVDLSKPHRLRISMGSLYPSGEDVGEWRTRVQVKLDDAVVLEGDYLCHPTTRSQIMIGKNLIGGSTCGPKFSGRIQRIDRPDKP